MERLLDILATCISNSAYLSKANDVLADFEKAKGYAPALVQILRTNPQKPIQTLSGILLKNLILDQWERICFEDRAATKQEIFACLGLPDAKLRNLASLSLAGIIHQEYPDKWNSCFQQILSMLRDKSQEHSLIVLDTLTVIFQECDDRLSKSTPLIMPALLELYKNNWNEVIRDKIIEVAGLCLESLSWADGVDNELVEMTLSGNWWTWFSLLSESIASPAVSFETKQKVLKLLTCFYRDYPIFSQKWIAGIIPVAWIMMYSLVPVYVERVVFNKDLVVNLTLEDNTTGVEGLSSQLLELISCVVIRPGRNETLVKELPNFISSLLWYIMLTVEQQELWKNEPNQFIVEDDPEEGWRSARITAIKLVSDVIEIFGDTAVNVILQVISNTLHHLSSGIVNLLASTYAEMQDLCQITNGQLENLVAKYPEAYAWKMREAVVLLMGSLSKDILMFNAKAKKKGNDQINIGAMLYQVVLKDLKNSKDQLRGRSLWCIGKISDLIDNTQCLDIFIETCSCMQSRSVAVKLSACYAIYRLSQKITGREITEILTVLLYSLVNLLEEVTSDTLHIVLDTLLQVSRLNEEATSKIPAYAAGIVLKMFTKYYGESNLNGKIMALLRCWCDLKDCLNPLVDVFCPLVLNLISVYPTAEKITSFSSTSTSETKAGLDAVMILPNTLEIIMVLLKKSQSFSQERLRLLDILVPLLELLGKNDESSVLLHGTACLRTFAGFADKEIVNKGLVDKIIESTLTLLDPYKNEAGALNLGYYIVNIFSKLSPQIDQDLLVGCMTKLYRCKMPSVVQGFVLVFARLIHSYTSEIISFLSDLTVERRVALKVLLDKWLIHQPLIRGRYSKNCTITALTRLYILKDSRIESLLVVGYNPSHSNVGSEVIAPFKILSTLIRCLDNESFIPKRKAQDIGLNDEFQTVIEGSGLGLVGEYDDPGDRMDTIEDDMRSEEEIDPMVALKTDLMKEIKEDYDANDFKIPVSKDKGLGDYETGSECLMSDMLEFDYEDADDAGDDFHEDDLYSLADWYGSISLQSYLLDFFNNLINSDKEYLYKCIKHLLPEDIALFRKHFSFN